MSLNKPTVFRGVATALITPFRNNKIDFSALENLIEEQIRSDIGAILVAGTTGEASTLNEREHTELVECAAAKIAGRVPLLAGCSSNSTSESLRLAENACRAGADALLAVTPYYNKASDRGLLAHYRAIANHATRPLLLYNVPARTGVAMHLELYRELANHPNIVGIKEASGDLELLNTTVEELGDRMDVYTGNDTQLCIALKLGAQGIISVYSNLFPHAMNEIRRLHESGELSAAARQQQALRKRLDAMFREVNPIPVKYVASLLGICSAEYRLPLCPPSSETCRYLRSLFAEDLPTE